MKEFAALIRKLDSSNKTSVKVEALTRYFGRAHDKDKVWAIAILSHRRPPRPVNTTLLREWASELARIPSWLFEESYHIVGDLAETIALVIPSDETGSNKSLSQVLEEMIELKTRTEAEKKEFLFRHWQVMDYYERFVFTKLITGAFRIGLSQKLMTRALAQYTGLDEDELAYKLMGNWDPATTGFRELVLEKDVAAYLSKPYPFYLAYPLDGPPEGLGEPANWVGEHKWDGIRAQLILRAGELFIWSRGEELVTDKYPEFNELIASLPMGTVLDGEILAYPNGQIGTFNDLQTRIGRKTVSRKLLQQVPVIIKVYDLLESKGRDIRHKPFLQRRELLENLYASVRLARKKNGSPEHTFPLQLSETMEFSDWKQAATARERAREERSEGLMLKRKDSPYLVGRKKGDWWKWKVAPLTADGVLTYAMRGHGRRSNLFTDYTFALWEEKGNGERELVTFAKAYSGLTDAEFREVDTWIRRNTLERFGPVRSVSPELVFEIAFEGISLSKRHKSGVATRFPRILRWRKDKSPAQANTLEDLKNMIP